MSQRKVSFYLIMSAIVVAALSLSPYPSYAANTALEQIQSEPKEQQLDSAVARLSEPLADSEKLALTVFVAEHYFANGDYQKATRYFLRAEQLSVDIEPPVRRADYAKKQGIANYYRGHYLSAVEDYSRALQILEQANEPLLQAHLYNNIGLALMRAERLEQAIDYYGSAKALYDEYGSEQDKVDIIHNIAGAYISADRFDAALEMYATVGDAFTRLGDTAGLAQMQSNLGIIYRNLGQLDAAAEQYRLALANIGKTNDSLSLHNTLMNLADLYFFQGRFDDSLATLEEAKAQLEVIDYFPGLITVQEITAKVLYGQGEYERAEAALAQAYALARQNSKGDESLNTYLIELLLVAAKGDTQKALVLFEKYERERDLAVSRAIASRLNDFHAKYNTSQLQRQVESLQQQQEFERLAARQRNQFTWLIAGLLLLSLIIGVLLYRRAAERKANAILEEKVRLRTQELETLAQQLSSANEIKSQFLANISHEIRTPLTSIMGQAEAIIHGEVRGADVAKELRVIYNNSQHLGELINDVLDLSKIEANKLELNIALVSLDSLLADINAMFAPSAQQRGIGFYIDNQLAANSGAELDYIRVKQVLVNLCSNAIKFTEQGAVTLKVSGQDDALIFCVEDTGIGIAEDKLEAIFTTFSQGDNSISRRFGGTGLGLSLSQQLACIMGGQITVTSTLGSGSCFCFKLPCRRSLLTGDVQAQQPPRYTSSFNGSVVLAEDHPDNRRLIERILQNLGVTVYSAENGEQAVELALQHNPDLVLMDIQMPILDGLGALSLLHQCGFSNPIIALTANAMTHEIAHYKQVGFAGHLAKPIDKAQFCAVLERYLSINEQKEGYREVDMSDLRCSFAQTLPAEIALLKAAQQRDDIAAVAKIAHRLAGAAKMFADQELAQLLSDIERAAKFQDGEHVSELLHDLAMHDTESGR
ncbi:tetratricopeptide repeat protein [Pseudoalteromonas sp. T1lg48]|uniref:tetratricopeptide repeat protein n=1 Tax=Pseudoalteromonas sp. T1lg48 TaxID=2077100 RepID=UPI00131A16E5|nr:tetratricopeptide repeat protein [Pseudoalteromonas sp. T1lg48]